jgi:hypothetical protein
MKLARLIKLGQFANLTAVAALVVLMLAGATATATAAGSTGTFGKTSTSSTDKTATDVKQATGTGSVQGYASDAAIQYGTIVELSGKGAAKVQAAEAGKLSQMYGVAVDPHGLSLTVSNTALQNESYVATSGTFNVLVSTQTGAIKPGDYITMSAINGVGMKAGTYQEQNLVFGRAAGGFDGKSNSIGATTLKYDGSSATQPVQLGLIPVAISIQRNPNEKSTKANLPPVLQKLGQAIADKPVGPLRIYLSIGITGLSIMVALTTLYAGIRNALIAIGRNPLSKKSIFRGLAEIIITGFLILIIGLFAVYLLLKL